MKRLLVSLLCVVAASAGSPSVAAPDFATAHASVLVHVADGQLRDARRVANDLGLRVGTAYPMIDVFVATGPEAALAQLGARPQIEHLEPNRPLDLHTDTSHEATRGTAVLKIEHRGRPIDGRGIGVAVVDSGVDGTHPDLADRMGGNVRIVCARPGFLLGTLTECGGPKQILAAENTDTSGHGTHVAGTVAGTGAASDDRYHGAAPGSTIYGVGMGTGLLVENALDGLRWVLDNHDKVKPRIRVVNNSWGSGYDPANYGDPETAALTKMVELLVDEGITVVFSAGNLGGDGSEARTSLECTIPAPGVVCVANFDDGDASDRDGSIRQTSSRGLTDDPSTWPDVAAPGSAITAACSVSLVLCVEGGAGADRAYATMTGTSMAAPHVAGIVAQLLQVRPSLTPARVEDVLEDTAYELDWGGRYEDDPANRDGKSSFDKGHGLVDALAAVRAIVR